MQKIFALFCYHIGIWGIVGFFATLIIGFLACCADLSKTVFLGLLALLALVGIASSVICTMKNCRK